MASRGLQRRRRSAIVALFGQRPVVGDAFGRFNDGGARFDAEGADGLIERTSADRAYPDGRRGGNRYSDFRRLGTFAGPSEKDT